MVGIRKGSYDARNAQRERGPRINDDIRGRRVLVIDPEGNRLGILTPEEALQEAHNRSLDLVEVAPNSQPPVCRIMDFGKFKYEQSKKEQEARKRQHVVELKELVLRPNIDDHDIEVKLNNARRFLEGGNKVKITVRFKGREIVHRQIAEAKLKALVSKLEDQCIIERNPSMEGRLMTMVVAPAKNSQS